MLEVKLERCAGIDVGKRYIDICVLIGPADHKPAEEVRRFRTTVRDLEQCRAWLVEKGCSEVVMESTGSYWKPVFNVLEGSVKVTLANPEQVKALRGKKTDRKDCRWLAGLLRHGLVQASFIPPRDIRELRDLTRRRRMFLECRDRRCWRHYWKPTLAPSRWRTWLTAAYARKFPRSLKPWKDIA